jgi:hypothetical protein
MIDSRESHSESEPRGGGGGRVPPGAKGNFQNQLAATLAMRGKNY